ncbi:MAG: coproporphyrinogen dehydrogenase HemZ [Eubacterium sp.]|nr:coproporphyrinogen dehydrogenase HemZ [Eubacterium sp.]
MIVIEIKPDDEHSGGEFSYDLRTLAFSFYPNRKCEVRTVEGWRGRIDYPMRIFYKDKMILDVSLSPYDKEIVKRAAYGALSSKSKTMLPWGILTGIRPAKIAYDLLTETGSRQEAFEVLMDDYLVYQEKAELALDVAANEHMATSSLDLDAGYSVYVGIPFCPSICQYCTFSSYPLEQYKNKVDDYLDALSKEFGYMDDFVHSQRKKRVLHSLYVGGGTPTSLNDEQLKRLIDEIHKNFPLDESLEFTVEAGRPDTITGEKMRILKDGGVTRVSINPQSMIPGTLKLLGRTHSVAQVREAFGLAREAGIDNINMDIIVGLPEEDEVDFYNTLNQVYDLGPDSITVHTLVIKRASRLRREQIESYGDIRPEDTLVPVLQKGSYDYLKTHGYEPYYMYRQKNAVGSTRNTNQENVAYARLGKECLYNILMMEELEDIIAFGSGGSSKKHIAGTGRIERIENVKSVDDYISRIEEMKGRKLDALGRINKAADADRKNRMEEAIWH